MREKLHNFALFFNIQSENMSFISSILTDMWHLCNSMSPYILLGFLLSGLLHEFMPGRFYTRYLSGNGFRSVLFSALFGIPLPLCSCGVIPTAMGLRREGASRGATVSFLIATPQTGIDSIIATYSLMGLPFAVARPLVALFTSVFGGLLINRFVPEETSLATNVKAEKSVEKKQNILHRLLGALRYGMVEMIADIGKWLMIGLFMAGIITTLVPEEWFSLFQENSLYSMLVVLLFSIPMYLCATGSIPIAVALMLKGLTPGAALVLLMAGPASNMASILVIRKVLGMRTLVIYLLSIIIGAFCFGLGIDSLLPREWFTQGLVNLQTCCQEGNHLFSTLCTILLAALLFYALVIEKIKKKKGGCHCETCSCAATQENKNTLKINGMQCNHCAANVQKAIESIPGIAHADVSLGLSQATIQGDGFNPDNVIQAVKSLGFEAEWMNDNA